MDQQTFAFVEEPTGSDAPAQDQEEQQRPEGLPEKFDSVEDLAKSYQELESKLGEGTSGDSDAAEKTDTDSAEANKEAVENVIGVDAFDKYSTEYSENEGKLTEDSYKELQEKYNFSRELVDSFIRGQEALTSIDVEDVYSTVGGQDQYNNLMQWASENLPEAEVEAYNNTVQSADMATIKMTLQGLNARYSQTAASPSLITGTGKASSGGYESKAQMIADMSKPEYKNDAAFRDMVERKLVNTAEGVF